MIGGRRPFIERILPVPARGRLSDGRLLDLVRVGDPRRGRPVPHVRLPVATRASIWSALADQFRGRACGSRAPRGSVSVRGGRLARAREQLLGRADDPQPDHSSSRQDVPALLRGDHVRRADANGRVTGARRNADRPPGAGEPESGLGYGELGSRSLEATGCAHSGAATWNVGWPHDHQPGSVRVAGRRHPAGLQVDRRSFGLAADGSGASVTSGGAVRASKRRGDLRLRRSAGSHRGWLRLARTRAFPSADEGHDRRHLGRAGWGCIRDVRGRRPVDDGGTGGRLLAQDCVQRRVAERLLRERSAHSYWSRMGRRGCSTWRWHGPRADAGSSGPGTRPYPSPVERSGRPAWARRFLPTRPDYRYVRARSSCA